MLAILNDKLIKPVGHHLTPNRSTFPEKRFRGMPSAEEAVARTEDLKKIESAPAANPPLSAACRCANRPPSNPSVFTPNCEPGQK